MPPHRRIPTRRAAHSRWVEWHPSLTFAWWAPACDRLVAGLALPGAAGFGLSVRDAWRRHRGVPLEQQGWIGGAAAGDSN
eukprot:518408-Prymnesium_polylepis.1